MLLEKPEMSFLAWGSVPPGRLSHSTGDFGEVDFLPKWRGKSLVKDLARIFKVTVALENDGDAGALGEAGWGAGKNKSRLIYVTVGTGIGGGTILDGRLYRGVEGAHPEVGHQVLDPAGPVCSCGFRGCWESLAAGPAMAAWFESYSAPKLSASRRGDCETSSANWRSKVMSWPASAVKREAMYLGLASPI